MSRKAAAARAQKIGGLDEQQKAELTEAFGLFDSDGSGKPSLHPLNLSIHVSGDALASAAF